MNKVSDRIEVWCSTVTIRNCFSFLLKAIQKCEEAEKNYVDIYGRNHNSTAAAIQQIGESFSNV